MPDTKTLLSGATGTGAGASITVGHFGRPVSFQATVAGTGSVSATVLIQVSHDGTAWATLATITLSGTTSATDGVRDDLAWPFVRANVSAISGTGAAVTATMAV